MKPTTTAPPPPSHTYRPIREANHHCGPIKVTAEREATAYQPVRGIHHTALTIQHIHLQGTGCPDDKPKFDYSKGARVSGWGCEG